MALHCHIFYSIATFYIVTVLLCETVTLAQLSAVPVDNAIEDLYDTLLQREYAGSIVFPKHQVERKAQRSPSLRLRFGRRSDAELPMEKRWFGNIRQKPIRSPSLRLRFGRRSDPAMPLHSAVDEVLNNMILKGNNDNYNNNNNNDDENIGIEQNKPQGVRWERSLPYEMVDKNNNYKLHLNTDIIDALLNSPRARNLLMNMRQYEQKTAINKESFNENNLSNDNADDYNEFNENLTNRPTNDADDSDFQRESRKHSSPIRLRFGRSVAKSTNETGHEITEKNMKRKHTVEANTEKDEIQLLRMK